MLAKVAFSRLCTCLVAATVALAQSNNPAAHAPTQSNPSQPVLILHSLCVASSGSGTEGSCETVITKEDFDSLIAALDPHMPESNRLFLATEYAKLLVLGNEAERLKLDQDPTFKQLMAFTRLQLLERQLVRQLEQQASQISQADISGYYREHLTDFGEGSFLKIYIPKEGKWTSSEQAELIQKRAAGGEDFGKLQQEVWTAQGRPSGAPTTQTGTIRRSNLTVTFQKIFDLRPGEVSSLISDSGGYYVYKLLTKEAVPEQTVSSEIRTVMANQRLQERISKLRSAVMISVNEDYFGPLPSTEELAKHHGMEHQGSHMMPMSEQEKKR